VTYTILIYITFGSMALFSMIMLIFALIQETKMEKKYKVFFDDIRTVEMVYGQGREHEFEVVRNVKDFKALIEKKGIPGYISFDHDLGLDEDGEIAEDAYDAVKWMVYEKEYDLRDMDFGVHSDNPVGADSIMSLIRNWNKELHRRNE
jgi:hypothetical protein